MRESTVVTRSLLQEAINKGDFELANDLIDITDFSFAGLSEEEELEWRCLAADVYEYYARSEDLLQVLSPYLGKISPRFSTINTARLLLRLGSLNYLQQEYAESLTRFELAKGFFQMMADDEGSAMAIHYIGRTYWKMDHYEEAISCLNEAIAAYDRLALTHRKGVALLHLASTLEKQGDITAATDAFYAAERVLADTEDTVKRASCTNNIGLTLIHKGDYQGAIEKFNVAIQIFSGVAHIPFLAASYNNLAWVLILVGNYEKAESFLITALELHRANNDTAYEAGTLDLFGLLRIEQGRYKEAERFLARSLMLAQGVNSSYNIAVARATLGKLWLACKKPEQAILEFREAAAIAERIGDRFVLCEALLLGAESYLLLNEYERVSERLAVAKQYLETIGNQYFQARYVKLKGQLDKLTSRRPSKDFQLTADKLPTREEAINQLDEWLTRRALEQTNYNTVKAAKLLGVSRIWLYELKKRYDIMSQKLRPKN
ncbi:MAG: tetratricopeptide repeat protein [Acidobacteriota bacterium]